MVFDISKEENDKTEQRTYLKNCPQCGSGDVRFDEISVRPYCAECKYWPPVHFGTKSDVIKNGIPQSGSTDGVESYEVDKR